jgi:hypothetical protein
MDDNTENRKGGELGRVLNFGDWKNIATNIQPRLRARRSLEGALFRYAASCVIEQPME